MSVKCKYDISHECQNSDVGIVACPFNVHIHAVLCCKGYEPEEEPLKACPFCGNHNITKFAMVSGRWHRICDVCGDGGPLKHDDMDANEAWNTRAQQ